MTYVDPALDQPEPGTEPPAPGPAAAVEPPAPAGPTDADRELAFARLGVSISEPLGSAAALSYKGDLADSAAMTAHAKALGLLADPAPAATGDPAPEGDPAPPDPTASQSEARQGLLGTGFTPPAPVVVDPYETMAADAQADRDAGRPEAVVLQHAFQNIIGAARDGNTSVSVEERHAKREKEWAELGLLTANS